LEETTTKKESVSMEMMGIRGVLLDVDGTLVESNDAHAHAWVEALSEYGFFIPFELVRPLIGMGGDKLLPTVTPGLSSRAGMGQQIAQRRTIIFLQRYAPRLQPTPGARALIQQLHDDGLGLAVATSAHREELATLLQAAGVADLVSLRISADDADASKPDADPIEAALQRLHVRAAESILLGDTPYDIAAGRKVGVATIALRCGGFSDQDLSGALALYDTPAALLAAYTSQRAPFSAE
jgi:HAD superfamily hydrolase (TIGR01509 family)